MDTKGFFSYMRPVTLFFMALTLGGVLYLAYIFISAYQGLAGLDALTADIPRAAEREPAFNALPQPDSSVLHVIQDRDIFSAATLKPGAEQQAPLESLPENLKVVGIVIAEAPQVVIEDSAARQTYFVSAGKSEGGITLRHADKHRIVLDYQGQNISLPVSEPAQQTVLSNVAIP